MLDMFLAAYGLDGVDRNEISFDPEWTLKISLLEILIRKLLHARLLTTFFVLKEGIRWFAKYVG